VEGRDRPDGVDAPSRRHRTVPGVCLAARDLGEEAPADGRGIVGSDPATRSVRLHGARADGSVAFRRTPGRGSLPAFPASRPRSAVAMEACARAHDRGRETATLMRNAG